MSSGSKNAQNPFIAATMGLEFAGSIAVGALIGWLFDRWLNTAPRGLTIGTIVGLIGGGMNFVRMAVLISRNSARNALTPQKRTPVDIPPPSRDSDGETRRPASGRYDPRGPVDILDNDDDDPTPALPPDHDKW